MILQYGCQYFRRKLRKAFHTPVVNRFISGFDRYPYETEVHFVTTAQNSDYTAITGRETSDVAFRRSLSSRIYCRESWGRFCCARGRGVVKKVASGDQLDIFSTAIVMSFLIMGGS